MPSSQYFDIKINKNLIDTRFDGYKLSLKPIECTSVEVPCEVNRAEPNLDQYSFVYAKLFTLHNNLHNDPWNPSSVYFIGDNLNVFKGFPEPGSQQPTLVKVWNYLDHSERKRGHLHCSLVFTSEATAVCSDGAGLLYILDTGDRAGSINWKLLFTGQILGEANFIISDARCELTDGVRQIHCILTTIEPNVDNKNHDHVLHWVTLIESAEGTWGATDIDTLRGKNLHYCSLEPGSKALYIASDSYFKFANQDDLTPKKIPKLYTWQQTNDDLAITLKCDVPKYDLKIKTTRLGLLITKSGESLLNLKFSKPIDPDLTTWEIKNNTLAIVVCKEEVGLMWPELELGGDFRGEQIVDPALAEEIHNKLSHLCSDKIETADGLSTLSSCPVEECDINTSPVFGRYERANHSQTHSIGLSGCNYLFSVSLEAGKAPGLVLRHDVDACLFDMSEKEFSPKHVGTLNAFGYVQASKQQKKYLTCAPDTSYAVIAESSQHIFLYRQKRQVSDGCELRHRGTGNQINNVAEQQLIALPPDDVIGIYASNNILFVLKPKRLMLFFV